MTDKYTEISNHFYYEEQQKKAYHEITTLIGNMTSIFKDVPRCYYDNGMYEKLYYDCLRRLEETINELRSLNDNRPKWDEE